MAQFLIKHNHCEGNYQAIAVESDGTEKFSEEFEQQSEAMGAIQYFQAHGRFEREREKMSEEQTQEQDQEHGHAHTHTHTHAHDHKHYLPPESDPVDPAVTLELESDPLFASSTPIGYFLQKAAKSPTQTERTYWLGRVDSARYFAARDDTQDYLDQRAKENAEADARLFGTEASLITIKIVGNAVILQLVSGENVPAKFTLVRRLQGQTGTTGYGPPNGDQWVVQGLDTDSVHEFAVVSEDGFSAKEVIGPWLAVPIGNVTTIEIQDTQRANAQQQYDENEAAERERERIAQEAADTRREQRRQDIAAQEEAARIERAKMDQGIAERQQIHDDAVEELPLIAPRDVKFHLRDLGKAGMVADITFRRGKKKCQLFQFKVNGTVLGYFPDGRHSGRKSEDHIYERTVTVIRGQKNTIQIYGVTAHGNSGDEQLLDVPNELPV